MESGTSKTQYMSPDEEVLLVGNRRGGKRKYHRATCQLALNALHGEWGSLVRRCTLRSLSGTHRINEPAGCCKPTDASTAVYVESMRARREVTR